MRIFRLGSILASVTITLTSVVVAPVAAQQPYVSPRVDPRAVKVDPQTMRVNPGGVPKTVPEGGPTTLQAPPPKRQQHDRVIQFHGGADTAGQKGNALQQGAMLLGDVSGPTALGAPVVNVPGMNSNAFPPDTVGDIGRNHYVQMTNATATSGNTAFQIFDKTGADLSGGTLRFGGLWPAGDPCNSDLGDPIVVYDHLADRWLLSQFARNAAQTQFWMCVAISQTPNPVLNTWFIYTLELPVFPDYPKFGVWPDGYYMSSYEQSNLGVFVFDRNAMITGAATAFTKFTINALGAANVRDTRILPADLDGPAPPAGTPEFFVRPVDDQQDPGNPVDRLEIYEFSSNWTTNTFSFNLVTTISGAALAAFDIMTCNRTGGGDVRDCIPEPDTASTVDALSNRPMMQLKYRHFAGHDSMVFNQTIDVSGSINALLGFTPANEVAGIRWYELQRSGGPWGINQQGTYAPQSPQTTTEAQLVHRWMGSAAMDKNGNIALGYSVVNDDDTNGQEIFPGIRYSGRRFDDLAGQLGQTERIILNGTLSETGGAGQRWGDYSAMSVDPVDDCTFYFTTHVATGANGKPTRIAAFRFDTCGTDLAIFKTDTPDPVVAGGQLRYDLQVVNQGALTAEGVVVTDTLPAAGVTYVSDTGGCTLAAGTLTCSLGNMAPFTSRTISIQVAVSSSAFANGITTLTNTATVTALSGDFDPTNNTATASTVVVEQADLRVIKTCKPDGPATANSPGHCDIQVDNLGLSDARNVTLTDAITSSAPFTITTVTVSPSGSCLPATPIGPTSSVTLTCDLGTMLAGTRKTVRVDFTATGAADVNDVATVSSATPDPDTTNNQATGSVSFTSLADLAITKTDSPDPVVAGTNLTYVILVQNNGPSAATNVVVKDTLPGQVSIVSAISTAGTCNGGIPGNPLQPMICTIGSLATGGSATITLVVLVSPGAPNGTILVNNATVQSDTQDTNNANNSASSTSTVQTQADLTITKTSDALVYKPSSLIAYTITVANTGPSDAKAVVVSDVLPPTQQALYQSNTGGCTLAGAILTCQLGDMALGMTRSFNVYLVVKGSRGQVTNTASVGSATVDPNSANNTSIRVVTVGK